MGYEKGSVFIYDKKFWLLERYSTKDLKQTYFLRGLDGELIEAFEKDCVFLVSPSEVDPEELEKELNKKQ